MNLWQRLTEAVSGRADSDSLRAEIELQQAQLVSQEILQAVVDAAPVAITLLDELGQIVFANAGARELFFDNEPPEGKNFLKMLAHVPAPLRAALLSESDHVFTHESAGESETYHLAKRLLTFGERPHSLLIVRHMTLEFARQENAVLRKAMRVIHHELANSLTPVISLLRSVRNKLGKPEATAKLEQMLGVIEDRVMHLNAFLTGFAALGRLPKPRLQEVRWEQFLGQLRPLLSEQAAITIHDAPAAHGWFDPTQLQQVVINLVKNAREAGSPDQEIVLEAADVPEGGQRLSVLDRGAGMSAEVLENAMVPLFTTRPNGSGMGLTLCREIADAHRGHLRIARREGGGVRQLENAIARCVALATGTVIGPEAFSLIQGPVNSAAPQAENESVEGPSFREQMEAFERNLLTKALAATGNNQSEAARRLGLNRATLYDRLKKYGLLPATA